MNGCKHFTGKDCSYKYILSLGGQGDSLSKKILLYTVNCISICFEYDNII